MTRAMPLATLLPDVAGIPLDLTVTGLVQDSRHVRPGDAFVAIGEGGTHGLRFAAEAHAAGAVAVLYAPPLPADTAPLPSNAIAVPGLGARLAAMADTFNARPSAQLDVVGVTGTNGKTSTVQLLAQAWTLRGRGAGSIGTLGAGLYGHARPTGFTTPLVLQVHALLGDLRDAGADAVAMEVSSHALDQGRTDGVRFRVAVFTNLTRDHLDYHGDMQAYGDAKLRLFASDGLRAAVVNIDDAFAARVLATLADGIAAVTTSARGDMRAMIRAEGVVLDAAGIAFDLVIGDARRALRSPLLGRFNVDNLLAVAGVLHALGEPADAIATVLARLLPVAGRMNRLGGVDGLPLVVVDYAHTPDALQQALDSLRAHAAGRITCVFGCGGERDAGKRAQMARVAEHHADVVIVTDDNPRAEDGDAIVSQILAGFDAPDAVLVQRDRAAAIVRAVGAAGADDIVLVAGKGHEPYQEIDGVRHPFDDTLVASTALESRA